MAVSADELEKNKFFLTLQNKYKAKFDHAQKRCWIICIPCQSSLDGVELSEGFYDCHMLKPSPYYKGYYISSTGTYQSHSFEILDQKIKTSLGTVKILMEEVSYNEDYKPCRILIIERPLNAPPAKIGISYDDSSSCTDARFNASPSDYQKLLKSFPKPMMMLDKRIEQFCLSYVFLPDYLHDAAVKLHDMLKWAKKIFIESQSFPDDHHRVSELSVSLEFYILSKVHNKLFPVIRRKFHEEDANVTKKLFSLYENDLTPDQLGVQEPFCCQTPSAIVELASLNIKSSPTEKLLSLMATLEFLNQDIGKALHDKLLPVNCNKDMPCITSDDLIPLCVNVIVQARPLYLASNLYYIQNFSWHLSREDKLSFSLVTFQAAKEFLKGIDSDLLKPSTKSIKREISLDELMVMTVKSTNNRAPEGKKKPVQSAIDYQLENVTKMIEASTLELAELSSHDVKGLDEREKKPLPKTNTGKKDEKLGGFLSDLQQTNLGFGYGRKT